MYFYVSFVSMLLAFASIAISIKKKVSPAQKWMLLTSICAMFFFAASYYRYDAESLQMLIVSQKLIYVSASFLALGGIRAIAYVCEIPFKEWQKWTLIVVSCVVALASMTIDVAHAWYKKYEAIANPNHKDHLMLEASRGWLFYTCGILLLIAVVSSAIYIFYMIFNRPGNRLMAMRAVMFMVLMPFVSWLLSLTGVFADGGTTHAIVLGIVVGFIIIQINYDVLSTESVAKERLVESANEGLIIIDNNDGFFYANKMAKSIMPVFTRNNIDAINKFIKETILTREIYEINEHSYRIRIEQLLDEDGLVRGKTVVVADITEQINSAKQLSVLNNRLEVERAMFRDSIFKGSMFTVVADITEGKIIEDIVDPNGVSLLNALGFTVPAPYDEEGRAFVEKMGVEFLNKEQEFFFTREGVLAAYEAGRGADMIDVYISAQDAYVRIIPLMFKDPVNGHLMCYAPCKDITARKKRQIENKKALDEAQDNEMKMSEVMFSLSSIYNSVHVIDIEEGKFSEYFANTTIKNIVDANEGTDIQSLIWNVMLGRITGSYYESMKKFTTFATLNERMAGNKEISTEVLNTDQKWMRFSFIRVGAVGDRIKKVIFVSQNIDHERREEEKLRMLSTTDELTGLYNRHAFNQHMADLSNQGIGDDIWVVALDLNGLKITNDTKGHKAGDEIIVATARCCKKAFGDYGKTYRLGGDEFVAVIRCSDSEMDSVKMKLDSEMQNWSGEYSDKLSFSKGFVCSGEFKNSTIASLLKEADTRMYADKQQYYKLYRSNGSVE